MRKQLGFLMSTCVAATTFLVPALENNKAEAAPIRISFLAERRINGETVNLSGVNYQSLEQCEEARFRAAGDIPLNLVFRNLRCVQELDPNHV